MPPPPSNLPLLTLCLISDGKAGHDTQLQGLEYGLSRHFQLQSHAIQTPSGFLSCWQALRQWSRQSKTQSVLVAGAGSGSWRYLVLAKKIFNLKTVVLLRPRLWPHAWFDQIVAPFHDELPEGKRVICTEGVLNPVAPAMAPNPMRGLFLIGGPSRHHGWDEAALLQQIRTVVQAGNKKQWQLTNSRRTPTEFLASLQKMALQNLTIVPVEQTPRNWVGEQLQQCGEVWVTEDSMSMVFEGLSAGVQVGLLTLPRRRDSRVTRCIDNLIRRNWVTPVAQLADNGGMSAKVPPLQEAVRVSGILATTLLTQETSK